MHGSASRKFVLVPALVAVLLLALAPVASAKEDPHAPPTTAKQAPPTTRPVEAPPTTTATSDPPPPTAAEDPGNAQPTTEEPVPTISAPQTIFAGPIGPIPPPLPQDEPPPQPNPRITLTPNTDLQHLQTVQVDGTGFSPNHSVGAAQCRTGGTTVNDCDISRSIITSTDENGAWTGSLVVSARIRVGGELIDCTELGACGVGAARLYDYLEVAGADLVFDPNTAIAPPPVVTVTPSTNLVHDQEVTVNASGFAPNDTVQVVECAPGDPYPVCSYDRGPIFPASADANGALTTQFAVQRFLGGQGGPLIDCAEQGDCYLQVGSFADQLAIGTAVLSFDPDAPVAPRPTATATPSTGLVHRQEVALTGSGFSPNEDVQISQCSVSSDPYPVCSYSPGIIGPFQPPVDGNGNLNATFAVRRLLGYPGDVVVDCAEPPGCVLRVFSYVDLLHSVDVPISFDPDVPLPPPPSLAIEPNSDLVHNQSLTVSGSGFLPNDFIDLSECLEDENGVTQRCVYSTTGFVESDANGEFTTTFTVKRVLGYPGEPLLDCLDAGACALYARSYADPFASGEVELHFDPDAPLPPPPTLTIDPGAGLPARASVHVTGSGFAPNTSHNVVQCTKESTFFNFTCIFGPSLVSDDNGNIDTQYTAQRFIPSFPEPIDCAEPDRCIVAAFSYEDPLSVAGASIGFDPNAPPLPKPIVTLSQSTGLSDGQTITLTGSGFSSFASVGFGQCNAGADGPEDCEPSTTRYANADAQGSFTAEFVVKERIERPDGGTLDCTTGPGVCILGVANIADWSESPEQMPLSFGAPVSDLPIGVGGPTTTVRSGPAPRLAFTGTPVAGYLEFSAISLGLGALLVIAGRKRRLHV